jgi:phospholipid/cholesterol/gamma-HCH transport system ATP-binding protein
LAETSTAAAPAVIEVAGIVTRFGANAVHDGVSFSVARGTLAALIGGSGTGKSVLLREIIGLHRPTAGRVRVLGTDMWQASSAETAAVRRRFGMTFQDGALFSSLTVAQNVAVPLAEHTAITPAMREEIVRLRLAQAGLHADVGPRMPSELSGGMRKRAALARALALEPEILFLDEPTSGLDPTTARAFDTLVRSLVDNLGITVFLVTHDLDTLLTVVDRLIVLAEGKVRADGAVSDIVRLDDAWIRSYFAVRTMLGESSARKL